MKLSNYTKHKWMRGLGLACVGLLVFSGCREEINKDDLYTFTGETVESFLEKNDTLFSRYVELLGVVRQSDRTQSTISKLLSAYGNYTCFAPTNEAIKEFLDSAYVQGKFASNDFAVFMDSVRAGKHLGDSLAKVIVFNSIIDCGNTTAYEMSVFPEDDGVFSLPNLNDRYLTAKSATENGKTQRYLLEDVKVIYGDNEVENGYVHGVNKVVAPSTSTVSDLFKETKNMTMFALLFEKTGWADSMSTDKYLDEEYEDYYMNMDEATELPKQIGTQPGTNAFIPEHRKYGFTVFAETDDVFTKKLKLSDPSELIERLNDYLKEKYSDMPDVTFGTSDEDLKRPDNAINQFVAYHLLPVSLPTSQLVYHFNEKDFDKAEAMNNNNIIVTVPVFEYYETMSQAGGPRRLLKITESKTSGGKRLNRKAVMNTDTYQEESVEEEGILINTSSQGDKSVVSALNGYIYSIDDILVYTNSITAEKVLNERLRIDGASLLNELINLGYRRPMQAYSGSKTIVYFPEEFKLKNIQRSSFTTFAYSSGVGMGTQKSWSDYQGDELMVVGNYDITIKLPPVPYAGTYEIRWGLSGNEMRGMCQVYFGEEGTNLTPVDIPMDLRMNASNINKEKRTGGLFDLNVGWEEDAKDANENEEVNKNLRNNNWMKGPRYFKSQEESQGPMAYDNPAVVRKILTQQNMDPNKTYYLRLKSALDDTNTELFFDYIEIVPSSVYNNTTTPEDEW